MDTTSRPSLHGATPLRPAAYAGIAAAFVSIAAAIVIRVMPSFETVVVSLHLALTTLLYVTGGALATRLGGQGWRAGLFAGLLDALIGHTIAFFVAAPPDASRMTLPRGVVPTPHVLAQLQLWGAVVGAGGAILLAVAAGAFGAWYARRTRYTMVR